MKLADFTAVKERVNNMIADLEKQQKEEYTFNGECDA